MTCCHCAHNRPLRASDGFYSARCRRGYPHQDEGCAGFVGRSDGMENSPPHGPSSESEQNIPIDLILD